MSPEDQEKLCKSSLEAAHKYEQDEFDRLAEISRRVREAVEKHIDDRVFNSDDFKKAFDALRDRRRPASRIVMEGQLLADIAGGPVHCGHCNDELIVEADDYGPGGCPTFEDCPALGEPWHLKK